MFRQISVRIFTAQLDTGRWVRWLGRKSIVQRSYFDSNLLFMPLDLCTPPPLYQQGNTYYDNIKFLCYLLKSGMYEENNKLRWESIDFVVPLGRVSTVLCSWKSWSEALTEFEFKTEIRKLRIFEFQPSFNMVLASILTSYQRRNISEKLNYKKMSSVSSFVLKEKSLKFVRATSNEDAGKS